ncbi:MAG: Mrp/NBP35 family ATP-binding protein [Proteobacteria bacterium]|nr:Mrp/NBP35 family ATP-binding protein [Pseudomonadota bacterium]
MASLLTPDRGALLQALDTVTDPLTGLGLQAAGRVTKLELGFGRAAVRLEAPPEADPRYATLPEAVERALRSVPGVHRAHVVMAPQARPPTAEQPTVRVRKGARLSSEAQDQTRFARGAAQPIAHVRRVVAVASGKGGVGKSTVAVNLACALAALGFRVGVADADVYGPSLPRMLGLDADPEIGPDKKLIPVPAWGVWVMSIGFMVDEGAPMIWRGPMASSAVNQILHETAWGSEDEPLDVLLVDLPPGTGDVQLTLVQKVELAGAVIVSTPQEIALIDARRAAAMFGKTGVPILGVVENMAFLPDPAGGAPIEIFGRGGARREAERLRVPFLGEIPIDPALRAGADAGRPLVATDPNSPTAQAFMEVARRVTGRT